MNLIDVYILIFQSDWTCMDISPLLSLSLYLWKSMSACFLLLRILFIAGDKLHCSRMN